MPPTKDIIEKLEESHDDESTESTHQGDDEDLEALLGRPGNGREDDEDSEDHIEAFEDLDKANARVKDQAKGVRKLQRRLDAAEPKAKKLDEFIGALTDASQVKPALKTFLTEVANHHGKTLAQLFQMVAPDAVAEKATSTPGTSTTDFDAEAEKLLADVKFEYPSEKQSAVKALSLSLRSANSVTQALEAKVAELQATLDEKLGKVDKELSQRQREGEMDRKIEQAFPRAKARVEAEYPGFVLTLPKLKRALAENQDAQSVEAAVGRTFYKEILALRDRRPTDSQKGRMIPPGSKPGHKKAWDPVASNGRMTLAQAMAITGTTD